MKQICLILPVMFLILLSCTTNTTFSGKVELDMQNAECTKMACHPQCCNQCRANIIAVSKDYRIQLFGDIIDTAINGSTPPGSNKMIIDTSFVKMCNMPLICKYKQCDDPVCSIYELGKTYKLTGKYIHAKGEMRYKAFFVTAAQKID